jgi:hypothetical protein
MCFFRPRNTVKFSKRTSKLSFNLVKEPKINLSLLYVFVEMQYLNQLSYLVVTTQEASN